MCVCVCECVHIYAYVCVCVCSSQIQLARSDHTSHLVNGIRYLVQKKSLINLIKLVSE